LKRRFWVTTSADYTFKRKTHITTPTKRKKIAELQNDTHRSTQALPSLFILFSLLSTLVCCTWVSCLQYGQVLCFLSHSSIHSRWKVCEQAGIVCSDWVPSPVCRSFVRQIPHSSSCPSVLTIIVLSEVSLGIRLCCSGVSVRIDSRPRSSSWRDGTVRL
jgi:hypothetical protein